MGFNKNDLEKLRTDPYATFFFRALGIDKDKFLEEAAKDIKEEVPNEIPQEEYAAIEKELQNYIDAGIIEKCGTTADGETLYRFVEKPDVPEQVETFEPDKPNFLMNANGLKNFIQEYVALESKVKKLKYVYGVDLGVDGTEGSIHAQYSNIIWKLIRLIFGDENASDIADYCFGNSNFDNVEALYEELT